MKKGIMKKVGRVIVWLIVALIYGGILFLHLNNSLEKEECYGTIVPKPPTLNAPLY